MILSFDNLPLNNDLLKGIYNYGLLTPSSLQFDLLQSFLLNEELIIESSFYLLEKYECVAIASLQLDGTNMIVVENKKIRDNLFLLVQQFNKYLSRSLYKSKLTSINEQSINIITIQDFNELYKTNNTKIKPNTKYTKYTDLDNIDNIFFLITNELTKKYCHKKSYLNQECWNNSFIKQVNTFIFDNDLNAIEYELYEKYYNIKMNKFEPSQLQHYYSVAKCDRDRFNGNCIDNIYRNISIEQSVIYVNNVELLYNSLAGKDYPVSCFYENMTLEEKYKTIDSFLSGNTRLCICNDKCSTEFIKLLTDERMNFERISHIIHLDLPLIENYLLRIPYHIDTKHIFITNLENIDSFEHKNALEQYFKLKPLREI